MWKGEENFQLLRKIKCASILEKMNEILSEESEKMYAGAFEKLL